MISLQKNEQFMESFSNTLQGKRFDNKYENNSLNKEIDLSELEINIKAEDSILRSIVESEDKFNVIENENNQISMDLIAPANGFISEGFNLANKHYGVDIVLKQRSSVKAISEGIVLFSDWTLSTGYNVVIYHKIKLVRIFTTTSKRCLGEYPQTVAGLRVVVINSSLSYSDNILSHSAL